MVKIPSINYIARPHYIFVIAALFFISFPHASHAEMHPMTEVQNGVFHLAQANLVFTAETFYTDRFIDKDQAEEFAQASRTEPYLPADQDNYPFSLIDHNALGSDLDIVYAYNSFHCCPYPAKAYLSRHNISIADYTDQKSPPAIFYNVITANDPYHNERVRAIYWKFNNSEVYQNEVLHNSITPREIRYTRVEVPGPCPGVVRYAYAAEIPEKCYGGYMLDAYVKVISGCWAVWHSKAHPPCEPPEEIPMPESPCPGVVTSKKEIYQVILLPMTYPPFSCGKAPSPEEESGPCCGVVRYVPETQKTYMLPTGMTYADEAGPPPAPRSNPQCDFCR
jgi:hypothetical protein